MAGLAATIRTGGKTIASRALSPSQSGGASRGSKAAPASSGDWTAGAGADDGGEWVKVGAREWDIGSAQSRTDDSGFIVSESLTRPLNFRHGVGASILAQG